MKIESIYCDRCGRMCEISRSNHGLHLYKKTFVLTSVHEHDKPMDLCKICYDSLAGWYRRDKE